MAVEYSKEVIREAVGVAVAALGYAELRPQQRAAVEHFLDGKDVFVCLPTGSGKSLCYCLLPKAFDVLRRYSQSVVVVVSPLIALMKDQVRAMRQRRVAAVYTGEMDDEAETNVGLGKYQLVFMSPEALLADDRWCDMLMSPFYKENLMGLVVDEAHCVKKW